MEFLKEHKTIIIIIAVIAVIYFILRSDYAQNLDVMDKWYSMSTTGKIIIVLLIAAIGYYLYKQYN